MSGDMRDGGGLRPERYDVVVVGAGPAGLAAASELRQRAPEARVLLLDAGRGYRRRPCPVDRGHACRGCGGTCNVISGFGGCMHHGDGIKLSLLPAGRRLVSLFGEERADRLCAEAFGFLTAPLATPPGLRGTDLPEATSRRFVEAGLQLREYPVAPLSETELARVIESLHERVAGAVPLQLEAEVTAVTKHDDGYELTVDVGGDLRPVRTAQLVLATGRRGIAGLPAVLDGLGVMTKPSVPSVGVRLEMPFAWLDVIGRQHPDLKVAYRSTPAEDPAEGKVKTFCFCGGPNGGRIKFTRYFDLCGHEVVTLDGHLTTERPVGGRPLAANFGLLTKLPGPDSLPGFVRAYADRLDGRPAVQRLADFLARRAPSEVWPELRDRLPFGPSVNDVRAARLDALFTDTQLRAFETTSRRLFAAVSPSPAAGVGDPNDVLVVGPEIEFFWDEVVLDAHCETTSPGLFVVGDAAGLAQGVVQGAMTGLVAGRAAAAQHAATQHAATRTGIVAPARTDPTGTAVPNAEADGGLEPDPWPPRDFAEQVAAAVDEYLRLDGRLSLPDGDGPVRALERAYEDLTGATFALACNSGTSALHSAYVALDLGPGDEVLASPYSFHSTVSPLLHLGATPVLCDVDPDDGNLDPRSLEAAITPATRAVVVTHLYGRPADMGGILAVAARHRLAVVEDCSHAHGARIGGRPVGSLGDVAVFSLQANKLAPAGEGGILVTSREDLHERAVTLGHFGPRAATVHRPELRAYAASGFGLKYRLHPLGAVAGLQGLEVLRRTLPHRRAHAAALATALADHPLWLFRHAPSWSHYLFRMLVRPGLQDQVPGIVDEARSLGFPLRRASLRPLTDLPLVADGVNWAGRRWQPVVRSDLTGMESFVSRCLSMPTWYRPESAGRRDRFLTGLAVLADRLSTEATRV